MYKEQRCLSCHHLMIAEVYQDETRYYCPEHPYVNKYEYRLSMSNEMYKELDQVSGMIRRTIFPGIAE